MPVDTLAIDGTTPFHLAVWQNHRPMCELLLVLGANAHAVNHHGCNAAMWAAQSPSDADTGGSTVVIAMLVYLKELNVDLELINVNGQGCLHKAAQRCRRHVCEWLLDVAQLQDPAHFLPNKKEQNIPSALVL